MTPAFSADSRRRNLDRLGTEPLDVLILGGGINGAGIARDLALRGRLCGVPLRIGLVEQRHFASGTSGKNSQLIHGGLRYLKQLEFRLVSESLHERAALLEIAPHLVEPLPMLVPMYGPFSSAFYSAGVAIYNLLAGRRNVGEPRFLTAGEVARIEPELERERLTSAAIFYDCLVNSARFLLENIFDAARDGVVLANYARAEEFSKAGDYFRVRVTDQLGGETIEVAARKLVDATGPWKTGEDLRLVRGSHIILPRLNASQNAIAHFEEDGRIVFLIPWGPNCEFSLVGTTDVDHESGPDNVRISSGELRYLLRIAGRLFAAARDAQPIAAYSSLRPLLRSGAASPTRTSREHRIWNSPDGVLNVAGGKYTTYRAMSAEAADRIAEEIAPALAGRCATAVAPLGGNCRARVDELLSQAPDFAARHGLGIDEARRVVRDYGLQATNVFALLPAAPPGGLSRLEAARIAFAVEHEMAQRLPDLLFVSSYWGYERNWNAAALEPVACAMSRRLGWDPRRMAEEIHLALRILAMPAP